MNLAPSELMAGSVSNLERLRKDAMTSQKHRGFTQYVSLLFHLFYFWLFFFSGREGGRGGAG